jgi:predicted nucleotidyltransferase
MGLNLESETRLRVATGLARTYAGLGDVAAIIVGGSVARGWADRWSDVELAIYWTSLPTLDRLATLAHRAGVSDIRVFTDDPQAGVDEEWTVDGLKIDLVHRTTATVDQVIHDVIDCVDPTWPKQAHLHLLQTGIVLHGTGWTDDLRTRTAYPPELALYMVRKHLRFGPRDWLEMLAERNDVVYLYSLCCEVERRIVGTLLGVNRTFPPTGDLKWLVRVARDLPIAPADLADRLTSVFGTDPPTGVRMLHDLVEETIAIVEWHMPEIDTTPVRERLAQRRPRWAGPSLD